MAWVYLPSGCCPCSPGSPVSIWVSGWRRPRRGRSVTSRTIRIAGASFRRGSATAPSMTPRSGTTCGPSTATPGVDAWISSWAASPAPTCPWPDGERASGAATAAGSGTSSPGSLARWDPASSLWRMSQGCLMEEWERSLATFPTWGSLRNGAWYRRPTWAPPTSARGFSSWPTATVNGNYNRKGCSPASGDGLATAAGLWPTAGANDWKGSSKPGQRRGQLDEAAEQLFPCSRPDPETPPAGSASSPPGPTSRRQLNVRFVTWLMGLPAGWVDEIPIESRSLKHWETRSARGLPPWRSRCSGRR